MRFHLILIFFLSLALVYLLLFATGEPVGELNSSEIALSQNFDYYMTGVDRTSFNQSGQAEYRLQADRFTHYPEPDHIRIESPNFVIYRPDQQPWYISATSGLIENDIQRQEDKIDLSDNVVISHTNDEGKEMNIYTEFLTVYPDSRYLDTDREVRLESAGIEQSSTGMTADLNTNRIKLLSNVRGRYE